MSEFEPRVEPSESEQTEHKKHFVVDPIIEKHQRELEDQNIDLALLKNMLTEAYEAGKAEIQEIVDEEVEERE